MSNDNGWNIAAFALLDLSGLKREEREREDILRWIVYLVSHSTNFSLKPLGQKEHFPLSLNTPIWNGNLLFTSYIIPIKQPEAFFKTSHTLQKWSWLNKPSKNKHLYHNCQKHKVESVYRTENNICDHTSILFTDRSRAENTVEPSNPDAKRYNIKRR